MKKFTASSSNKGNYIKVQKLEYKKICASVVIKKIEDCQRFNIIWNLNPPVKSLASFSAKIQRIIWNIKNGRLRAKFIILLNIRYREIDERINEVTEF